MKKIGIIVLVICLSISMCACGQGILPTRSPVPTVMNDRHDILDSLSDGNYFVTPNAEIENLIQSYNKVADKDQQIQNYVITKDEDGSGYIIHSNDGENLSQYHVRLDEDGSPLTLTLTSGTADEKVACATAVMKMMWGKEFVPKDAQKCIDAVHDNIDKLEIEIEEFRDNYKEYKQDANFPTYDELKTQFENLKKDFENLKNELLTE